MRKRKVHWKYHIWKDIKNIWVYSNVAFIYSTWEMCTRYVFDHYGWGSLKNIYEKTKIDSERVEVRYIYKHIFFLILPLNGKILPCFQNVTPKIAVPGVEVTYQSVKKFGKSLKNVLLECKIVKLGKSKIMRRIIGFQPVIFRVMQLMIDENILFIFQKRFCVSFHN